MRIVAGALLILTAEQAFSHALLVRFPHDTFANQVLLPTSCVLLCLGVGFLIWGIFTEPRKSS